MVRIVDDEEKQNVSPLPQPVNDAFTSSFLLYLERSQLGCRFCLDYIQGRAKSMANTYCKTNGMLSKMVNAMPVESISMIIFVCVCVCLCGKVHTK